MHYLDYKGIRGVVNNLSGYAADENLKMLRKDTLWLMDKLFPRGFVYTANRGPSEPVHGGEMTGDGTTLDIS